MILALRRSGMLLFAGLCLTGWVQAEPAVTLRETELRKAPASDAAVVGTLPAQTAVEVIGRKGGWSEVRPTQGGSGWVKMFNLRYGDGAPRESEGGSSGLVGVLNIARSGSSGTTVTTGVKGLDITGDSLQQANPNPAELKRLHGFAVSRQDAEAAARQAGLKAQQIAYPGGAQ